MNLKPLGDRIIVSAVKPEEKTASGLFIPESGKAVTYHAVLKVGDDPIIKVKEGDKVVLAEYAGKKLTVDGQEILIVPFVDILAVVEHS